MSKKLLIIGSSLNYGSPGHICEELGLMAKEDGWDVFQAHGLKYSRPSKLKTYAVCSRFGEFKHTLGSLIFDSHGLWSAKETHKLVEWIEEISPDVIHLHNLHGYFLNYEILFDFLSKYNRPVIWTLHDFWPITGHCAHFDYIGCDKWKTECRHCPQSSSYPKAIIDQSHRNFLKKKTSFTSICDLIITPVSNWVGSLVGQSFLSKYPIRPIYNGVDLDVFKPTASNLKSQLGISDKFILLGVASPWYEMKGIKDYFALNEILPSDFQIIMIGLTKAQIQRLPKGIIGIERTGNQVELAQYYSTADVVLNLSYQETFGMTTVEGMACGTPGIVYNRTASPELVSDETGYIVEAGDIRSILEYCEKIKLMGKNSFSLPCRKRTEELFDKSIQFKKYIQLYNSLYNAAR